MNRVLSPKPAVSANASSAWRVALPLLLFVLVSLLWFYRETGLAMIGIWRRSDTFAHAFLVPPITLWLVWRRRALLPAIEPRPCWWFLLPLTLAAAAWLLGEMVAVNALTQAALMAMLVACVPLLLGARLAAAIAFPLAFLFFCVPVGEFMMPALMDSTADFTVTALRLSGIPVYREGNQFVIPSGNWSVVEACSGLRYLIASVMVGTLFAYLNYRTLRRRMVFVAFATVLPIVANWLRAYMIVMLGHYSGNTLAVGADHLIYGWVFFGIVMLALFMVGARWADAGNEDGTVAVGPSVQTISGTDAPVWPAALVALVVLAAPGLLLQRLDAQAAAAAPVRLQLDVPDGWSAQPAAATDWRPAFERARAELQNSYRKDQHEVGLHVAYYRHQDYKSKLISSSNAIVHSGDKQWARVGGDTASAALGDQQLQLPVTELRAMASPDLSAARLRVWQFYWIGGQITTSPVRAKLYAAWHQLSGQGDDSVSVIVYARKSTDNGKETDELLARFLRDNWATIEAALQRAQRER